jgi:hypothetical protein
MILAAMFVFWMCCQGKFGTKMFLEALETTNYIGLVSAFFEMDRLIAPFPNNIFDWLIADGPFALTVRSVTATV